MFITTSYFDDRAKRKAESVQGKIIRLIDGEELTKLMIKHNIGVQVKTTIDIKKTVGAFRYLNDPAETIQGANIKIVTNAENRAIYISRMTIPFPKATLLECING